MSRKRTILHVFDHSLPELSGYAVRSLHILVEQRKRGWSTYQVTGTRHEASTADEVIEGFEFRRTRNRATTWVRWSPLRTLLGLWALHTHLRRLVRDLGPDTIHAHSPFTSALASMGLGVPVVYEVRTLWEEGSILAGRIGAGGLLYRIARSMETSVLKRAKAVVVISAGLRDDVIGRGVPADRVFVIPNGVDPETHAPLPPASDSAKQKFSVPRRFVLGYVGSLFAWEGLELLIRAIPRIRALAGDVGLLIVGNGPAFADLKSLAGRMNVDDNVVFTGRLDRAAVHGAYQAIDVLVYPRVRMRLTELVTPLKPLEAMALGRPVLASDVGGHKELIRDGETGRLFSADDIDALANGAAALLLDENLRACLVTNGLRFVKSQRNWSAVVGGYEGVYDRAMARS